MNVRRTSTAATVVSLLSSLVVVVGAFLPWVKVGPDAGPAIPAIYIAGMDSGMEVWGQVVVPAVLLSATAILYFDYGKNTALLTLLVGGLTVAASLNYVFVYSGYLGTFVPAVGVYLTLTGGIGLVLGGGIRLFSNYLPSPPGYGNQERSTDT